jgi:hypothetical protein
MQDGRTLHPKELALFELEARENGDEGLRGVLEHPGVEKLAARLSTAEPPSLLISRRTRQKLKKADGDTAQKETVYNRR